MQGVKKSNLPTKNLPDLRATIHLEKEVGERLGPGNLLQQTL